MVQAALETFQHLEGACMITKDGDDDDDDDVSDDGDSDCDDGLSDDCDSDCDDVTMMTNDNYHII